MGEHRDHDHIRSYVKRATRMTASQKRAYEEYYDRFCIGESVRRIVAAKPVDERTAAILAFFPRPAPLVLEIGFGMGDATAAIARQHATTNYLGVEVHKPGVGKLLGLLAKHAIENVRIIQSDAIGVLEELLSPASLAAIHLFFPDPWPKKRHQKRRLIRPAVAQLMASRLRPGGVIYMVTDWEDYAESAMAVLASTSLLENCATGYAERADWRPTTAFELKGREAGRPIREILFRRVSCT
jgi:tRNA (guanine-N7-)-methyltransferase